MKNTECGIKRAVTNSMLFWLKTNNGFDQMRASVQYYLDLRCGDPTTKYSGADRETCILRRWAVACAVMAPVLQKIPDYKVQPLFDAVKSVAYAEWGY